MQPPFLSAKPPPRRVLAARPIPASQLPSEAGVVALILLCVVTGVLLIGYIWTERQVFVSVAGRRLAFKTHQRSVGALLQETGLVLHAEDRVQPDWEAPLGDQDEITIVRARVVTVDADGQTVTLRTQANSAAAILQEAHIRLQPRDRVTVNAQPVDPTDPLPAPSTAVHQLNSPASLDPPPVHVAVQRAVPFFLNDGGVLTELGTTATTVGRALLEANIPIYLGDLLSLPLDTPVAAGLRLSITRSRPITILADGRTIRTRTRAQTVAEALAEAGLPLRGKDYAIPRAESSISEGLQIQLIRVKQEFLIEEEPIPFQTEFQPDPELEIDHEQLAQAGANGVLKRRIRIDYENGQEVNRTVEAQWVDVAPRKQIHTYGTRIVLRELDTPQGPLQYWRKLRVLATSYTAATSGKSRDHPQYGITRLGWQAGRGIIAVDPRYINFLTRIYVPGYGIGIAADTGGAIRGLRIDLGYDEDEDSPSWYRYVDIYLLAPPPPPNQIRWRLK